MEKKKEGPETSTPLSPVFCQMTAVLPRAITDGGPSALPVETCEANQASFSFKVQAVPLYPGQQKPLCQL